MPIRVVNYGFWSPLEFEYECDRCGHPIEEDDVVEAGGDILCPSCAKELEEDNEVEEEDDV